MRIEKSRLFRQESTHPYPSSPKSDDENFESACSPSLVVFGGGARSAEGAELPISPDQTINLLLGLTLDEAGYLI